MSTSIKPYLAWLAPRAAKLAGFLVVPELYFLGRSYHAELLARLHLDIGLYPKGIEVFIYDGAGVAGAEWSTGILSGFGFVTGLLVVPFVIAAVATAFWSPGARGSAIAQSKSLFSKAKDKLGWLAYLATAILVPLLLLGSAKLAILLLTPGLKQAEVFADKADQAAANCGKAKQDPRCVRVYLTPARSRDGIIVAATETRIALAIGNGAVRTLKVDDVIGVASVPAPRPSGKSAEQLAREQYLRKCGKPSGRAEDVLLGVPRLIDACRQAAIARAKRSRLPTVPSSAPMLLEAAKGD
jgi:hypothetical protein